MLFGPNAAGKSNLLDAIQALSRIGTMRTVAEALSGPIRGHPTEAFAFGAGGLEELLDRPEATFFLKAEMDDALAANDSRSREELDPYRVGKGDRAFKSFWDELTDALGGASAP